MSYKAAKLTTEDTERTVVRPTYSETTPLRLPRGGRANLAQGGGLELGFEADHMKPPCAGFAHHGCWESTGGATEWNNAWPLRASVCSVVSSHETQPIAGLE